MRFSVKPVFILLIAFLQQLPIQLFFTAWAGGFFGGLVAATHMFPNKSALPFLICGCVLFVVLPFLICGTKKLNYQRTEYKFFDDRLEFEEGFFTINKKVIKYKDIKEVTLRKGLLQRAYGLGTIYLATLATGSTPYTNASMGFGFGNISASGVSVRDAANPDELYDKVRNLVDLANA